MDELNQGSGNEVGEKQRGERYVGSRINRTWETIGIQESEGQG